ncbi:MAG: GntR family transcriptional regulator [Solirubrobacterales bacterium]
MPDTIQQQVLQELRSAIVRRELPPGMPVRADAVAGRMGVSRIPVREALRVLEAEGLVTSRPHKGVIVAEMNAADLHEIYLLRGLLETEAARRAVPVLSGSVLAELDQLVAGMDEAIEDSDIRQMSDLNRKFHFTIYGENNLRQLLRIITMLWNQSDSYRSIYLANDEFCRQAQQEHRVIVDACHGREPERVIALLDEHRSRAEDGITGMLRTAQASA